MGQPPPANVPLGPGAAAAWSAWRDEAVSRARWGSGAPLLPSRNGRAAGRRRPRRAGAAGRGGGLSAALLAAGLLLLLASVGLLVYGPWREQQHLAARPAGPGETLPARRDAPAADGADRSVRMGTAKALGESAVWMDIPRIGVDAPVMEMQLDHGEYQVPSFDVGHHADSANPGQDGNSVYNGHLETIDAGHVFARLHELRPGDLVYVYTASYRFEWVVEDAHTVRNDDKSFLAPTAEPRLTLYTCAGTFDLRTHDYTHRLVVVARLAQVAARAHPAAQS
jgi:LPXTG-site transpeptidase (sortase) family protein